MEDGALRLMIQFVNDGGIEVAGVRHRGFAHLGHIVHVGAIPLQPGKRAYPELRRVLASLLDMEAAAA